LFAGCGNENDAKARPLIGIWVLEDSGDVARRTTSDDSPTEGQSEPRMQLEFTASGRLETRTNINAIDSRKTGTWQFIAYNDTAKVMDIECDLEGQKTSCEVEFVSEDKIKLNPPNMSGLNLKLTFKRK
jgi:hypothetical protein